MSNAKTVMSQAANTWAGPTYIEDVFSTYLYTGDGSNQTITNGINLAGEGGMVWIKKRDATVNHVLLSDEHLSLGKVLNTNLTSGYDTLNSTPAFYADGFLAAGSDIRNTGDYASWTFRKAPRFFDVVTFTYDGSAQIGHNLGCKVGAIIMKRTDTSQDWLGWYYRGPSDASGYYLSLNTYNGNGGGRVDTAHTDTYFNPYYVKGSNSVGTVSPVVGGTYVAYLFAHDPLGPSGDGSDGLISCGSFTHSSTTGNEIDLGWEPQWILVKSATSVINWYMWDTMRGWSVTSQSNLQPNTLNAESTGSNTAAGWPQITNTGFRVGTNNYMGDNKTYIYIAIRRGPMRQPESGTEVFAIDTRSGTPWPSFTSSFPVDMALWKHSAATQDWRNYARLIGAQRLVPNLTSAEVSDSEAQFDYMDGYNESTLNADIYSWMFRRAPGFFDVVAYTGTGTITSRAHNLGVAPELIILKSRTGNPAGWQVKHKDFASNVVAALNYSGAAYVDSGVFSTNAVTESVFYTGSSSNSNDPSSTYIAYLFASLAGVSKVGSYTGNGTSQTIDCGFTSGARFVLIKRTDSTGDWYVWDTARGIVAANDPHLSLNTTAAEVTTDDSIDPDSSGFIVNQVSATNINVSSANYIYLAIA